MCVCVDVCVAGGGEWGHTICVCCVCECEFVLASAGMPMTRLYLGLVVSSSTSTDAPLLLAFLHVINNISHSTLHIHYCLSSCMQVSLHGYHGYINREKKINCTIYTKTRAIDKASMVAVYIQLYAFKQAPAHVDGHSCFLTL